MFAAASGPDGVDNWKLTPKLNNQSIPPSISVTNLPSAGNAIDFAGREYYTATQGLRGNENASPVVIGNPVYTPVGNAEPGVQVWSFVDGGTAIDSGSSWIQTSNGNKWSITFTGDGTLRTATVYMDIYHLGAGGDYLITDGNTSLTLTKSTPGLSWYQLNISFSSDTTLSVQSQQFLNWSAFSLAAVVVNDDGSAPTDAPVVSLLSPPTGATVGGNSVVITGAKFNGASAVTFGSLDAASFTVDSDTQITAVAPPHTTALVSVRVTTPNGTSGHTSADSYTYWPIQLPLVQIVPVGDSITQANSSHLSYRYPLWVRLVDAGINFDLVGSENTNDDGNPAWPKHNGISFDQDHEGHSGWEAGEVLAALPNWLGGYTPDIALVHLGTNDFFAGQSAQSTVAEVEQIIDALRADNPSVTVLLAKIIPVANPTVNQAIDDFNSQVDGIAASKSTAQSPVVVVDQNTGFDINQDTYDGVHPNTSGEDKLAGNWVQAILGVLP